MKKTTKANVIYNTLTDTYNIRLQAPLSVCWQVTRECNLRCRYCLSDSGHEMPKGLETEQALHLIKELGRLGVNRLDFTGGEPLLREDLSVLLECAKEQNISTIVTTNALLLNNENMETLKKADLVQISIDGPEQVHNFQRGAAVFDKMIENIKCLRDQGLRIRLNSFIFNSNKQYVGDLIDLSKELNLFSHLFIIFTPQGRGKDNLHEIIPDNEVEKIKQLILEHKQLERRNIRLYDYKEYMHSCVLVSPFGDVISQGFFEDESIRVGNMLQEPLEELFANEVFDHQGHLLHYLQRRSL